MASFLLTVSKYRRNSTSSSFDINNPADVTAMHEDHADICRLYDHARKQEIKLIHDGMDLAKLVQQTTKELQILKLQSRPAKQKGIQSAKRKLVSKLQTIGFKIKNRPTHSGYMELAEARQLAYEQELKALVSDLKGVTLERVKYQRHVMDDIRYMRRCGVELLAEEKARSSAIPSRDLEFKFGRSEKGILMFHHVDYDPYVNSSCSKQPRFY